VVFSLSFLPPPPSEQLSDTAHNPLWFKEANSFYYYLIPLNCNIFISRKNMRPPLPPTASITLGVATFRLITTAVLECQVGTLKYCNTASFHVLDYLHFILSYDCIMMSAPEIAALNTGIVLTLLYENRTYFIAS
jgi:hypothetical protein